MKCPECQFDNEPGTEFCQNCSKPLSSTAHDATTLIGGAAPTAVSTDAETLQFPAPSSTPEVGSIIGQRYQILSLLGKGGMGKVYKVKDLELDKIVALKTIRPDLAEHPEMLERFKRELIVARQVTHRNVNRIFDLGDQHNWNWNDHAGHYWRCVAGGFPRYW